jgi:Uma2 family endonuclease
MRTMETLSLTETTAKQEQEWVSYEEYLTLPHEGRLLEWVAGEVIYHMPPLENHQNLSTYLAGLLRGYSDFYGLGRVYSAPFEMKCLPDKSSREPDILFVATANLNRLQDGRRLVGPADLVVEIVSRDSVARDYDDKFAEYEEAGVEEYWIIDPRQSRKRASFFQRGRDGRFETVTSEDGVYRSQILTGFWLKVDWLWEMPDSHSTAAEIIGVPGELMTFLKAKKQQGPDLRP